MRGGQGPCRSRLLGLVLCVVWTLGRGIRLCPQSSMSVREVSGRIVQPRRRPRAYARTHAGRARSRTLPLGDAYRRARYAEALELTPTSLSATEREVGGFGLISQVFHYDTPELVLVASLEVGAKWEWRGRVRKGSESRDAAAFGEVLAHHPITVAAGQFDVFHIRIVREDGFGTRQYIDLWFDPNVGPIKAVGELQWTGLIGVLQRLVGLRRLEVELLEYSISSTSTPQQPRPSSI